MDYPDLTKLHRWPYTVEDNPNTVIEPTTRCNLSCPGCYRVSKLAHGKDRDMTLEEIKTYIDEVTRLRNTSCISFLGGEPLLHPQLLDAIAYVKQKGLNVGVYSNGLILTKQRLIEFRDLGVSYVFIHVDKHQGRGDTEEEINRIREHFCDMFRRVGGVQLGFSFQFWEKDICEVHTMVDFFTQNADVVKLLNFAMCTNAPEQHSAFADSGDRPDTIEQIEAARHEAQKRMCRAIEDAYGLTWSAYLGSKYDDKVPGKLSALCAYHQAVFLGSADSAFVRETSERARRVLGKYPYIGSVPLKPSPADFKFLASNESIRNIYRNLREHSGTRIDWQMVAISFSPLKRKEGVNICESCTDSVLYKGQFTPMCTLEDVIASEVRHCSAEAAL